MSSIPHIPLDHEIAIWVLIPILVTVFIVAVLQDNVRVILFASGGKALLSGVSRERIRLDQGLKRAAMLRNSCWILPDEGQWRRRRAYFTGRKKTGVFTKRLEEAAKDGVMLKLMVSMFETWGPGAGTAMLKQHALNFIPTILLGVFVNHFFSGFIAAKLPFSLPAGFRSVLQSGLPLPELDTCYVSSLSWYILSLFGVRSLASLFVEWLQNFQAVQLADVPQQSMLMGSLGVPLMIGAGSSEEDLVKAERDNLHVTTRDENVLRNVEKRLLAL